jgi:hypothetical protein
MKRRSQIAAEAFKWLELEQARIAERLKSRQTTDPRAQHSPKFG